MTRTPRGGAARRIGVGLVAALAVGAATLLSGAPMALAEPVPSPSGSATAVPGPADTPSPGDPGATPTPTGKPTPTHGPTRKPTPTPEPTVTPAPSGVPGPSATGEPAPSPTDSPTPAPSTGTVTGTLTDSAGAPLAYSSITIQAKEGWAIYTAGTDADGHYTIGSVQPGSYTMNYSVPGSWLYEYVPHVTQYYDAAVFAVTAGQTTTVDDTALPTGTITGHLRDRDGHPVSARLDAHTVTGQYASNFADTDDTGAFSMPVFTGTYVVRFTFDGGSQQYAYQQTSEDRAQRFAVAAGATVVVDDTLLPTGAVSGRLTDNDGSPAAGAHVSLSDEAAGQYLSTTTAADGTYHFDRVPVGSYTAQFYSSDYQRTQWAYHTTNQRKAATVTVTEGQNTTVDDTFVPTGSLSVTATDGGTGQPLADFCVSIWGGGHQGGQCSDGTGTVTLTGVPEGDTYQGDVYVNGDTYLSTQLTGVVIAGGQTTTKAVVVRRAAIIETAVLDARSHQPVANVCVSAITAGHAGVGSNYGACTDDQGKVRISYLDPGTYSLFARPQDGVHGAQWVGDAKGTGNPALAKRISAPAGVTTGPTIYLDGAGSITGTVRDKATGAPVGQICVATTAVDAAWYHIGDCPGGATDADGRYTITGLGPYAWPVEFASAGTYAWQWSGGAPTRLLAKPVTVTVGSTATATADAKLSRGATIKGRVLDAAGKPVDSYVVVVDAVTGDAVGPWADAPTGSYTVPVLPGAVRIEYERNGDPYNTWTWYRGAADFQHATPVLVGSEGRTIDLVLPAS